MGVHKQMGDISVAAFIFYIQSVVTSKQLTGHVYLQADQRSSGENLQERNAFVSCRCSPLNINIFHRRCMKTCWWNCPLQVSSCPSFWEPAQMWTFTTWPHWIQRCIATYSSSRAMRVMWKSWALTSPWSTMI